MHCAVVTIKPFGSFNAFFHFELAISALSSDLSLSFYLRKIKSWRRAQICHPQSPLVQWVPICPPTFRNPEQKVQSPLTFLKHHTRGKLITIDGSHGIQSWDLEYFISASGEIFCDILKILVASFPSLNLFEPLFELALPWAISHRLRRSINKRPTRHLNRSQVMSYEDVYKNWCSLTCCGKWYWIWQN